MPNDQATSKMQHGQISVGPLFPQDQQVAIAIAPAMRSLYNASSPPRTLALGLALIATTANPRHHADPQGMLVQTAPDITQVHTQPRARRVRQSVDDNASQGLLEQHAVVSMRASDDQSQRQTVAISKQDALDAPFAAVGRVRAEFFSPPNEAFVVVPSSVSQPQSIFSSASHASSPPCKNRSKTPASVHSRNRR